MKNTWCDVQSNWTFCTLTSPRTRGNLSERPGEYSCGLTETAVRESVRNSRILDPLIPLFVELYITLC